MTLMPKLPRSPVAPEMDAATSKIATSGSANRRPILRTMLRRGGSATVLGPWRANRSSASIRDNPAGLVESRSSSAWVGRDQNRSSGPSVIWATHPAGDFQDDQSVAGSSPPLCATDIGLHPHFWLQCLFLLGLGDLRHGGFGQEQHTRDRHCILERNPHHLGGIDDACLHQIDIFLAGSIEAMIALPGKHASDNDASVNGRIFRDLAGWDFQGPFQNLYPRPFVTFAFCLFPLHGVGAAE